jgi:hypothetical protein
VLWHNGEKKMQRTFSVKREADWFAVKVEAAKDLGDTTRSLVKNTTTVAQMVAASLEASRPRLKPGHFTATSACMRGESCSSSGLGVSRP